MTTGIARRYGVKCHFSWLAVLAGLLMGMGCAPSKQEVAAASFGAPPDKCEQIIRQEMDLNFFRGTPGEYQFDKAPYKAAVKQTLLATREFGWIVEFQAKGPMLFGPSGFRTYRYFFPYSGSMALLTAEAIIQPIDEK